MGIPTASEIDPAAEFLAKEQEDIGEDLGLGAPVQDIATFDDANDNIAVKNDEDEEGKDIYAGMQTLSIKKDQEEPEFMRIWREEQQERLRREDETKYENNEMNHIEPGSEWERVAKHCDFSAKA